ncbi:MAG: T9SS type A sorting domain-containing protein [Flavobacteriales bacterium]|nr:hypothetical protein [Flavobacteriales bacterium]MCC6575704.1 T9SS type A sorting domain-containing protein [Flavobacteriales bacterium]NUQ13811.1 T9SS type A sorting domain-containing protein [Flavobacteriales bacterium]
MRVALIAFALLPWSASAQSWCPPGATWTYTYSNSWTTEGFARFTFIGDTVIGSDTCQLIDAFAEGWYYPFDTAFHYDMGPVVTKTDGDLVSILTSIGFDTLYWFAAAPGDHWEITMNDGSTSPGSITIVDTGTTTVQGVPLRYLATNGDTIYERIGSLYSFMLPWVGFVIDAASGPLHCYEDADINFQASWWNYGCESWLTINAPLDPSVTTVFPNPGTTHFTLVLPPGPHTITLLDATGRLVLQQRTTDPRPLVSTEALPAGLYRISIRDGSGRLTGTTWVKE